MSKILVIDPEKCTSCRLCELACSEKSNGAFRPSRSRIRIAIHTDEAIYFPMVCIQCEDAPCIAACESQALVRDVRTKAVLVVEENCTRCGLCEAACPYGVIRCHEGKAMVCDLCRGDPECVRFCMPQALRYEPEEQWSREARQAYVDRLSNAGKEVPV
jgi:Fe-S-cluster-containing hydrogenase component 2